MPAAPDPPPVNVGSILAQLAFVVTAALLVYGFVAVTKDGEMRRVCSAPCYLHPDYLAADRRAPDFSLKDLRGATVTLDSLRGKVVVLNFWTKTCGPCLEEMPDLAELAVILRDRPDVIVVTVSTDAGPEDVKPTLQTVLKGEPPFMVLFDPESDIVHGKFGTHLFPETWIIDKRGVIRARFDGGRDWDSSAMVELIDELRADTYCPVTFRESRPEGDGKAVCESFGGG
jgi:peroxiredoxin